LSSGIVSGAIGTFITSRFLAHGHATWLRAATRSTSAAWPARRPSRPRSTSSSRCSA